MDNLETKDFDFELKAVDDNGRFVAHFAAFNNVDRTNDIIEPGSFRNLETFAKDGWIGINHQMDKLPVAFPTRVTQDEKGLKIEGQFHSHPEAQACRSVVRERMAAGKRVMGSIGYKVQEPGGASHEFRDGKGVRRIKSLDLYEASFVNLPANPNAEALSAKSATDQEGGDVENPVITIDELKDWLVLQSKAGRALSKANLGKLREFHGKLEEMCSTIKEFVSAHEEPDGDEPPIPESPGRQDGGKGSISNPPPSPGTMKAGDERNTAGNALAAPENPHGAMTAADLRQRKEKALSDLRTRAVRVQTQFALMQ